MLPVLKASYTDLKSFLDIMQAATGPAMIISGLSFLLSIMASRYARCIDRTREIIDQLEVHANELSNKKKKSLHHQLKITFKRCRELRNTMIISSLCIFFVVLSIGAVFIGLLYGLSLEGFASSMFLMALVTLSMSLVIFVRDLFISLVGIKIEIQEVEKEFVS